MLHLQELVKQGEHRQDLTITERVPNFITGPCNLVVHYRVEAEDDFYLIHLHTEGLLTVICQRCLLEFINAYENKTTIAVCRSDERAEQVMELYECIVASNWQVDLRELIVDELYLYVPQFHHAIEDCDDEVNNILTGKN